MIILIDNSTSVKDIWALTAFDLTSTVTTLIIKAFFSLVCFRYNKVHSFSSSLKVFVSIFCSTCTVLVCFFVFLPGATNEEWNEVIAFSKLFYVTRA